MADGLEVERGFEYHANFIYNQPKLKNNRHKNLDWETSLAVVKFIVELMRGWRYDKTYYHDRDALPGGNIFNEFFTAVKKSSYTIVIVTKGFVEDCWGRYKSQAAFIKLLENSKSKRFIAVYVDIDDHHIPQELSTMEPMVFSANWRTEMEEWNRLRDLISYVPTPVQDTGRDIFPPTSNTPNNRGIQQYPHHAGRRDLHSTINTDLQRNPTSGLQETQPPDLTRARGSNVLEDSPLNGNVLADGPSSADVALNTIPSNAQSPVDDRQNSNNNHSLNDNQESLRSSAPTQSMSVGRTSSEESTTSRLSNDPSDMTTRVDLTTTSNRAPPDGEANTTTSGPVQGQSSQTVQREDSMGTDVKRLVSNENQDEDDLIYSSLNQADVEPDNQASGQFNTLDTRAPQVPLKLKQNVIKSSRTKPLPDQDFDQPIVIRYECLKVDDNDQDSGFLDPASLQRSDNSVNISPESIGANRINDQTPSPTTAGYSSHVQTPTSKDPDSLFNRMTSLIPDREMRSKAVRYFTNMLVKSDQSFM